VFPVLRYDDEQEEDDDLQGMLEQYVLTLSLQEYQPSFLGSDGKKKIMYHEVIPPENGLEGSCAICMELYSEDTDKRVGKVVCGHMFHISCIQDLQEFHCRCPCCRKECVTHKP
jgi:hypothetical protein